MTSPHGPTMPPDGRSGRCGRLDVGDVRGYIATGELPADELAACRAAAVASPAFDGADSGDGTVLVGVRTVAKLQRRRHERLDTVVRLERLRSATGIPAPKLLDHGTLPPAEAGLISGPVTEAGPASDPSAEAGGASDPNGGGGAGSQWRWWAVLERAAGRHYDAPTPGQQAALGAVLRTWHERGEVGGLRLDDPGGLGVLLGTPRGVTPGGYPELAKRFDEVCAGQPVTAIHGDAAATHNTLYDGDRLTAVIDSGGVDSGPPMLDLAWALAIDLPRGGAVDPLLDGYGRDAVDAGALDRLLPLMMARRLADVPQLGFDRVGAGWLAEWLDRHAPPVLAIVAPELGLQP